MTLLTDIILGVAKAVVGTAFLAIGGLLLGFLRGSDKALAEKLLDYDRRNAVGEAGGTAAKKQHDTNQPAT